MAFGNVKTTVEYSFIIAARGQVLLKNIRPEIYVPLMGLVYRAFHPDGACCEFNRWKVLVSETDFIVYRDCAIVVTIPST